MPLLNYTTKIEAAKTVGEIQRILAKHGAKSILTDYDDQGQVEALAFQVNTPHGEIGFRLPVYPGFVLKVLERSNVPRSFVNHSQAVRVAWRIVKDWIEAQMAILETEMVKMEQVFLPYMISDNGKTLYESMVDNKFLLAQGQEMPNG